jgi:branched-chain amino acid transport system ATP-binding protein
MVNLQGSGECILEKEVLALNQGMALSVAHRGYVLETGRIVLADSADRLMHNPQVQKAYLGGH